MREFYSNETRLLTEHSLLDDNGDRRGTPADWFQGIKAIKSANEGAALDGALATRFVLVRGGADAGLSPEARAERDRLEEQLREVRQLKGELPEAEYLLRLEAVLLQLAELYGESPPE